MNVLRIYNSIEFQHQPECSHLTGAQLVVIAKELYYTGVHLIHRHSPSDQIIVTIMWATRFSKDLVSTYVLRKEFDSIVDSIWGANQVLVCSHCQDRNITFMQMVLVTKVAGPVPQSPLSECSC